MSKGSAVFKPKDRVAHSVFGTGTIEQLNSRHTTILFDEGGSRKFVTEMVELEPSDTPAPKRPVRRKKTKVAK